jgi:hypothetical protein
VKVGYLPALFRPIYHIAPRTMGKDEHGIEHGNPLWRQGASSATVSENKTGGIDVIIAPSRVAIQECCGASTSFKAKNGRS